jgi:hypothetical protein
MTHPCKKSGNPGTTMHACSTVSATTTLCGLQVEPGTIGAVAGYTHVCPDCFPADLPQRSRQEDLPIGRRGDSSAS